MCCFVYNCSNTFTLSLIRLRFLLWTSGRGHCAPYTFRGTEPLPHLQGVEHPHSTEEETEARRNLPQLFQFRGQWDVCFNTGSRLWDPKAPHNYRERALSSSYTPSVSRRPSGLLLFQGWREDLSHLFALDITCSPAATFVSLQGILVHCPKTRLATPAIDSASPSSKHIV